MSDLGLGDRVAMEPVRLAALRHHGVVPRDDRPAPIPARFRRRWRPWWAEPARREVSAETQEAQKK